MSRSRKPPPKRRSHVAAALESPRYRQRVIPDKRELLLDSGFDELDPEEEFRFPVERDA